MEKVRIYSIPSLYRDDFNVDGFKFGSGEKSLCIVGNMRGNEYQQIYTCSQLTRVLKILEKNNKIAEGKEILVIPSVNPSSMNIGKRFWATDNTDINRMFPGYNLGETTQRIAAGVFDTVSKYENGIQFASFYMPGEFCPHVRMMKTGFENLDKAKEFGLPYIVLRNPKPYDTTTLNYNWQIWETNAFSLYTTVTTSIDKRSAVQMIEAVLRFMAKEGIITADTEGGGFLSRVIEDNEMLSIRPEKAGIFVSKCSVGESVRKNEIVALILDTLEGEVIEELKAPADGIVFFKHNEPVTYANTAVIKMINSDEIELW